MRKVKLIPHDITYAKTMSSLTSSPHVGLSDEQTSLEGTESFIEFIREQEKLGKQYSRCIVNENEYMLKMNSLLNIKSLKIKLNQDVCYMLTREKIF